MKHCRNLGSTWLHTFLPGSTSEVWSKFFPLLSYLRGKRNMRAILASFLWLVCKSGLLRCLSEFPGHVFRNAVIFKLHVQMLSCLSASCEAGLSLSLFLCQPLWRYTEKAPDSRLLVYRSEDIKNISRLASPKVCGYMSAEAQQLLPEEARTAAEAQKGGGEQQFLQRHVRQEMICD